MSVGEPLASVTEPEGAANGRQEPPLGQPAPPDVSGLVNLRDVGGLPTVDGRVTRTGVLYRSEMPKPGDRPPAASFQWPPKTVIDLRSGIERGAGPHPLAALGATVHVVPLLGEDAGPHNGTATSRAMSEGLGPLYVAMLDNAAPQIVGILELAAEAPGPLLVHCAAGKDRTGVTVAVLLRLAGVTTEAVLTDYAATGANMKGVIRRLKGHAILPGTGKVATDRHLVETSLVAAEQVIARTDGHPGGVAGWLRQHGASEATIDRWRARILA